MCRVSVNGATLDTTNVTFTVNPPADGGYWYGTRHYAIAAQSASTAASHGNINKGYSYFSYSGKAKIVPTHIWRIAKGIWTGYPGDSHYLYTIR